MGQPVDFVGLNTFIYEVSVWDGAEQISERLTSNFGGLFFPNTAAFLSIRQNTLHNKLTSDGDNLKYYRNFKFKLSLPDPQTGNAPISTAGELRATASMFNVLMLHRNGPYGYPTWRQIRASQNPLTRKQKKHNIFTYVEEPGQEVEYVTDSNARVVLRNRFSDIKKFVEDPLISKYKPLRVVGAIEDSSGDKRNIEIQTTLGNEMVYFDNDEPNKYFNVSLDESEGYEMVKRMYLHGALDSESSVMEEFSLLEYTETIYPSMENIYRNYIRSRPNFDFPWRDDIKYRISPGISWNKTTNGGTVDNPIYSDPGTIDNGFGFEVPYQSRWVLDSGWNFDTWRPKEDSKYLDGIGAYDDYFDSATIGTFTPKMTTRKSLDSGSIYFFPIGGKRNFGHFDTNNDGVIDTSDEGLTPYNYRTSSHNTNSAGGEGQLMNSYSMFADWRQVTNSSGYLSSIDDILTASATYSRKHLNPSPESVAHKAGIPIAETASYSSNGLLFEVEESFGGRTKWEANITRRVRDSQGNLVLSPRDPFDDTYDKFAEYTKIVGKDYSIVPEFRISNHVETYDELSSDIDNLQLFEVSGGLSGSSDSSQENFYKIYSNSDFMRHFKLIEGDHKDFVEPAAISLECKAIKKFLPYEGFYPAQRCLDLGKQFYKSYGEHFYSEKCVVKVADNDTVTGNGAKAKLRIYGEPLSDYYDTGLGFFHTYKAEPPVAKLSSGVFSEIGAPSSGLQIGSQILTFDQVRPNGEDDAFTVGDGHGFILCDDNTNCVFFNLIDETDWPASNYFSGSTQRGYMFPSNMTDTSKPFLVTTTNYNSAGFRWSFNWNYQMSIRPQVDSSGVNRPDWLNNEPQFLPLVLIKAPSGSFLNPHSYQTAKNITDAINELRTNSSGIASVTNILKYFEDNTDWALKFGDGAATFNIKATIPSVKSSGVQSDTTITLESADSSGNAIITPGKEDWNRTIPNFTWAVGASNADPVDETQMVAPPSTPTSESSNFITGDARMGGRWTKSVASGLVYETVLDNCANTKYTKIQPIITPLFAPGVLFNTIKSGIACDYPLMTDNVNRVLAEVSSSLEGTSSFWMIGGRGTSTGSFIDRGINYFDTASVLLGGLTLKSTEFTGSDATGSIFDLFGDGDILDNPSTNVLSLKENLNVNSFKGFNLRIPFEALIEPENYMSNVNFINQEPDNFLYYANHIRLDYEARWDGQGDLIYKKMAHNFLAEVPEFFLVNKSFKKISSLEQGNANFGNVTTASNGETFEYRMRVKMYRSMDGPGNTIPSNGVRVSTPQDYCPSSRPHPRETITMYSRPSAFGPPTWDGNFSVTWTGSSNHIISGSDNRTGNNFPFTPPYYHGEAWADIIFRPDKSGSAGARKYTLSEIIASSSVKYYRYWHPSANTDLIYRHKEGAPLWTTWTGSLAQTSQVSGNFYAPQHPLFINDNAMQLDASLNLFGKEESSSTEQLQDATFSTFISVDSIEQNKTKWVIQPKFETPILNFNHLSASTGTQTITKIDFANSFSKIDSLDNHDGSSYVDNRIQVFDGMKEHNIWFKKDSNSTDPNLQTESHPHTIEVNVTSAGSKSDIVNTFVTSIRTSSSLSVNVDSSNSDLVYITASFVGPSSASVYHFAETSPPLVVTHVTSGSSTELSLSPHSPATTTRGMWHQYGVIPKKEEGIYLRIEDVPQTWMRGALGIPTAQANLTASLADLVGFSKEPVKLGEISPTKEISEAVVAVPFIERKGRRKFFQIPRRDIQNALEVAPQTRWVGSSISAMVDKMKKYVFPPPMDFITNKDISPFAMYIFEFRHTLTKQDLADIWQNLPPDIGTSFEVASSTVSHELLSTELLGGGTIDETKPVPSKRNKNSGDALPNRLKWMVFKVKQKAQTNYYDKIVKKAGISDEEEAVKLSKASFNWPYDFFSLVELVKLDASVTFSDVEEEDDEGSKVVQPKVATTIINRELGRGQLFRGTPANKVKSTKEKVEAAIDSMKPKGFFK